MSQTPSNPRQLTLDLIYPSVLIPQGDSTYLIKPGKPQSMLTVAQFASAVGLSRDSIYRYISEGKIPSEQIEYAGERRILIHAAAITWFRAHYKTIRAAL